MISFHKKFTRIELNKVIQNYSITELVNFFNLNYANILSKDVGVWEKYSLEDHIKMVLNQFDKYFSHKPLPGNISNCFFRVLILVHDLGKPDAVKNGNKELQHEETLKLITPILKQLEFDKKEIDIASALIEDDPIGKYLRFSKSDAAIGAIKRMSKNSGLKLKDFFELLLVYYKCDAGSYTEDSGGKKSLDFLFNFDHKNKKLDFSKEPQDKINILKDLLFN